MKSRLPSLIAAIVAVPLLANAAAPAKQPQRQILVCVSDHASDAVRNAASAIVADPQKYPAVKALLATNGAQPVRLQSSEALLKDNRLAAYDHLIVIGLPGSDPLIDKVWEHYAAIDPAAKTLYAQGWGYLAGDLGYIEADRNPFLHSRTTNEAPFETTLIKISGTSEAGIAGAMESFSNGLINGIVPLDGWKRPQTTVLDLDPFAQPCPLKLPTDWSLAGFTQVPGNEYRAYADIGPAEPVHVWRYKFLPPDALDHAAMAGWLNGFQRMAWGNAVTIAEFETPEIATQTATAIGRTRGFKKVNGDGGTTLYVANQPAAPLKNGDPKEDENLPNPPGTMTCTAVGKYVLLSSLEPAKLSQMVLLNR